MLGFNCLVTLSLSSVPQSPNSFTPATSQLPLKMEFYRHGSGPSAWPVDLAPRLLKLRIY